MCLERMALEVKTERHKTTVMVYHVLQWSHYFAHSVRYDNNKHRAACSVLVYVWSIRPISTLETQGFGLVSYFCSETTVLGSNGRGRV